MPRGVIGPTGSQGEGRNSIDILVIVAVLQSVALLSSAAQGYVVERGRSVRVAALPATLGSGITFTLGSVAAQGYVVERLTVSL